uniref:Uncharacterized protein n=1 Tax=Anguilla anguilla TaxID=7936 RepID=A0A0E9PNA5_ANGAN
MWIPGVLMKAVQMGILLESAAMELVGTAGPFALQDR